jgi:sigma-B regulation protein RsbU (phosphoserine phosphatase)
MIDLGTIALGHRTSAVDARNKIKNVVQILTNDAIAAARLATVTSALCRAINRGTSLANLLVSLDNAQSSTTVRLSFRGEEPLTLEREIEEFFDEIQRPSACELAAVKHFPGSRQPNERTIAQLKSVVGRKGNEELMQEIQEKNRELENHRAHLEETVKDRTAQLEQALGVIQKQKERMEGELNIGREIQMSMIPLVSSLPSYEEFNVSATLKPAREVGGDFYDLFFVDEDRLCLCVGDVSGKGVPAALFMAMTKTLIKSRAADDRSTASILTHVNDELSRDNSSSMFVTVFTSMLNIRTGELIYTNAGHNPPHIKKRGGRLLSLADRHGPIIGAVQGLAYGEKTTSLDTGDIFLMYTDGVTEAMNEQGALFSDERLEQLIGENDLVSAENTVHTVLSSIAEFEGAAEQADDITILCIQYSGDPASGSMRAITISINNDISEIPEVDQKFDAFAEDHGLPIGVVQTFHIIFDELLNNIISYAFKDGARHTIEVKIEYSGARLMVAIIDDGVPFNPLAQITPDTTLSIEEREIGGLGIHIVKNLVDTINYHRKIEKNVLILVKNLEG